MTKWTYIIEWLFISMILQYCCSDNIDSYVCLETAIDFAWSYKKCWFTLGNAQASLGSETRTCSKKCNVKIDSLEASTWSNGYLRYQLKSVALRFDGLSQNLKTINTGCDTIAEEKTMEIICETGFENNVSKDLCSSTKECEDVSKMCLQSSREQIGVCVCIRGYIRLGNQCLKGGLKLNEMCHRDEQCSGAVGSVCQNYICACRRGYAALNDSTCFFLDISQELCTSKVECTDESKICSSTEKVGVCTCKPGFIGFGKKCLKGKLKLNETCERNEQCSMVFGSVCLNNTCVCGGGYALFNESECSLPSSGGNFQASVQDQKVSVTVGSVIGGLIIGIVLTVLALIIYQNVRNGKPKAKERKFTKAAVFNNASYKTEIDAVQNVPNVQRTNERKVINVPPFAHSIDLPVKKSIQEANKRSMANNDVKNDVYSHLHEKPEEPDIDENYDHAHLNINRAMEESDYSNLNTGIRYKKHELSASEDDYDVQEPDGDYCSAKKK